MRIKKKNHFDFPSIPKSLLLLEKGATFQLKKLASTYEDEIRNLIKSDYAFTVLVCCIERAFPKFHGKSTARQESTV